MRRAGLVLVLALGVAGSAGAEPNELGDAVQAHIREIHARNPELRDDAFSKMGGSSVASKAFLYCFSTPHVDLGEHPDLTGTIEYFDTGKRNSFNRESKATGVSWNLRYVLGGRPANFRKELNATQARWALVLFGGNDAQNENERIYLRRLVYLIEQLEEMGVVPVLGSALPRRNSYRNRWIRRFNDITEAVANHWSLPYIDYHAALSALPRKGLARDGVHPNVLGRGGVRTACQLTEKGLRYGNNVRNLLTLEMLSALRATIPVADTVADTDTGTDAGTDADTDTGTDAGTDPGTAPDSDADTAPDTAPAPDPFPISTLISKPDLPPTDTLPKNCGPPKPNSRHYRTRLDLQDRTRIRASGLDLDGYKPRVFWVRVDENGERCVRRRSQTLEVDARPGMWDLIVEVPERAAHEGQMLILIARNPR
ncbi:MAG: SGNH/GDSL hydrolase family protein [Deltaproteobacteria bacterium]|nr:SGNH/GDSL hydrolase family protein [Deltaproteobacteria bacterium]